MTSFDGLEAGVCWRWREYTTVYYSIPCTCKQHRLFQGHLGKAACQKVHEAESLVLKGGEGLEDECPFSPQQQEGGHHLTEKQLG